VRSPTRLENGLKSALDRYMLLLVFILLTVAAIGVVDPAGWGGVLLVGMQSATALLAVSTSDSGSRTRLVVRWVTGIAFGSVLLATIIGDADVTALAYGAVMLVLVGIVPVTVIRRLFAQQRITIQTIMGVLCVYLLVGLFFSVVYGIYNRVAGPFFANDVQANATAFVYFSYITLSTVGYGDLTPGPDAARMLAVAEALIGQLYLVSVVALTVSNLGQARRVDVGREEGTGD
jgi:hypothetical protein